MCLSKHAVPDNFKTTKDDAARLLTENITANAPVIAEARAWRNWRRDIPREMHMARSQSMNRRAAQWNWFSRLDPDLTMFAVFLLIGAAFVLFAAWARA